MYRDELVDPQNFDLALLQRVRSYYLGSQPLQEVQKRLAAIGARGYVFGGLQRSLMTGAPVRDLDVVVFGTNSMKLWGAFADLRPQQKEGASSESAFQVEFAPALGPRITAEVWAAESQQGLEDVDVPTPERVLETTFLKIEGTLVALDQDRPEAVDRGFREAVLTRTLSRRPGIDPGARETYYVGKIARIAVQAGMVPDDDLKNWMAARAEHMTPATLRSYLGGIPTCDVYRLAGI